MRWLAGVLVIFLSGGVAHCAQSSAPAPVDLWKSEGTPRLGSVREQLEHAVHMKRSLRGSRGAQRLEARGKAVSAYRAVREYFPREKALSAEASFRAGELLRSGGETELALAEFEYARILGRSTEFGPRAGLEIGHVYRRRGRLNNALACYEAVEVLAKSEFTRFRDLSAYWAGRVHLLLERPLDATRCYERAAREGVDPVQRTRAFDAWANVLIDEADLEGAAGVLELCRESVHEFAQELTQLGVRVRGALEAMRAPARLKREIERRVEN